MRKKTHNEFDSLDDAGKKTYAQKYRNKVNKEVPHALAKKNARTIGRVAGNTYSYGRLAVTAGIIFTGGVAALPAATLASRATHYGIIGAKFAYQKALDKIS